jgi:hypothetical protein
MSETEIATNIKKNNENQIIFTIARMNPPTSGHKYLIKTMILKALDLNLSQINIILSATIDNEKNPLECEEKRRLLYNSIIDTAKNELNANENDPELTRKINNIHVEIICMNDQTPSDYGSHPIISKINYILNDLYNYPQVNNIKMFLVIGQDRINSYSFLLDNLNNRIPLIDLEIIGLDRPENAMSATYIRQLALNGNKPDFYTHMKELGLSDEDIDDIYDQINITITKKPRLKGGKYRKTRKYKTSIKRKGKSRKYKKLVK